MMINIFIYVIRYVCVDDDFEQDILQGRCLVYSFGLANDWTFEEALAEMGCRVWAYDPTTTDKNVSKNIFFHKIGVAAEDKGEFRTLERIIKDNGHAFTKITFMKMDVEGSELAGLPVWISSGVLKNVKQLAMEVHLSPQNLTNEFLKNFRQLQLRENFRLFSWDPNLCWKNMVKQSDYYHLFEIVLKKIDPLDATSCCR